MIVGEGTSVLFSHFGVGGWIEDGVGGTEESFGGGGGAWGIGRVMGCVRRRGLSV